MARHLHDARMLAVWCVVGVFLLFAVPTAYNLPCQFFDFIDSSIGSCTSVFHVLELGLNFSVSHFTFSVVFFPSMKIFVELDLHIEMCVTFSVSNVCVA